MPSCSYGPRDSTLVPPPLTGRARGEEERGDRAHQQRNLHVEVDGIPLHGGKPLSSLVVLIHRSALGFPPLRSGPIGPVRPTYLFPQSLGPHWSITDSSRFDKHVDREILSGLFLKILLLKARSYS